MMGQTFRSSLVLAACCVSAALALAQTNRGDAAARYATAGQQALAVRAKMNSLAAGGTYKLSMEKSAA